ncbi:hypothetical protein [Telluribacter sp. SYSU D00476]|uniref:hypothetical protein n=1 Tax=Telluribacter sp. SYSU D00476 TaxID=2811430 RepID=UPI001FF4D350|nr:hypothetical protein [Telluribacter sp. SYSU D00476]
MRRMLVLLWLVWVQGERIAAAGQLLPSGNETCRDAQVQREPRAYGVVKATKQSKLTLLNCFTTIRDLEPKAPATVMHSLGVLLMKAFLPDLICL